MTKLPTAEQTGLQCKPLVLRTVQWKVLEESSQLGEGADHEQKYTKTSTPEDRAKVRQYAAQIGVMRVQNHFKSLKLSKSTYCSLLQEDVRI